MRFDTFIYEEQIKEDAANLLQVAILYENLEDNVNEAVSDTVKNIKKKTDDMLQKLGFHTSQSKGLIQYLWTINKNILRLIYHALNYVGGNQFEKEKSAQAIKEIAKSVNKEELINFLYKLDMVTLHSFTTPLKAIDALTGWHIAGEVKKSVEPAIIRAKKAIEWLEDTKEYLEGKLKAQVQKYVNALRRVFGLGEFKKIKA